MSINKVRGTYFFIRSAEEQFGNPVKEGDRLVYRGDSRFPWIDPIFDIPPGTICDVLDVEHDPADTRDHERCDNHYYYRLRGLEEHDRLDTTEIVALFDMEPANDGFDSMAEQVKQLIKTPPIFAIQVV